jgi:hypothetical protein
MSFKGLGLKQDVKDTNHGSPRTQIEGGEIVWVGRRDLSIYTQHFERRFLEDSDRWFAREATR